MGWDASRPVPYRRLIKEWAIFAPIMLAFLWFIERDRAGMAGPVFGLVISLPLYLVLGTVMAKFGYQRRTLAEMRSRRAAPAASTETGSARPRPAPTRRTQPGRNRPKSKKRRN